MDMPVPNVGKAIPFYEKSLRFKVANRNKSAPKSATLIRDKVTLRLVENGRDPNLESCYIEVSDVGAAYAELKPLCPNIAEIRPMDHDGHAHRVFFVRDPDGLCYCIGQRQGSAAQSGQPSSYVMFTSPILHVANMEEGLGFYRDVLQFEVVRNDPNYSILQKDNGRIDLRRVDKEPSGSEFYLQVKGIDTLWEHVSQFKGKYMIRDLFVQDYGMKEFHIIAPNNCLIFVGETIKK
jgi:catechol 2,3-dioxygenase-like lactoylglutathione lyase family enzyme